MPAGQVTKYNGRDKILASDAYRQWDDASAGNIMFCLCGSDYVPDAAHSTTADLLDLITVGDGAPIAATSLAIDDTTTAGTTYFNSDDANFGAAVTISAKWLIAVMPVTANTFDAATSKLLFYVDLDTTSGTAEMTSSASDFIVATPDNGWFKYV